MVCLLGQTVYAQLFGASANPLGATILIKGMPVQVVGVLGAKGQTIKEIGTSAREEIAEIVGAPVHLFLFVKVRERWGEDPERYREMGLDFPKKR